jgi:GH25 family lysozyme M1 (1,4-beta-N-acetylmuramidase)
LTGRYPLIYTNANWWNTCVGSDAGADNPLWVAHWGASSPTLPTGWSTYTFWQYGAEGVVDGIRGDTDENQFPGNHSALVSFADDR